MVSAEQIKKAEREASSDSGAHPSGMVRSGAPLSGERTTGAHSWVSSRSGEEVKRALVVDDEPLVQRALRRMLEQMAFEVTVVGCAEAAVDQVERETFHVVFTDVHLPGMNGVELLRAVRRHDLEVPVVLITGQPSTITALKALEYGALHYLIKPITREALTRVTQRAVRLRQMLQLQRHAGTISGAEGFGGVDLAGLQVTFESALEKLWIAYQPIVDARRRKVYAYEALMRSGEPHLSGPGAILDAAERLGEFTKLGRRVRELAGVPFSDAELDGIRLFVNLHVTDLSDDSLVDATSPLSKLADRVVLELTERASLSEVGNIGERVREVRELGFSIAIDDLGAGYAGLSSFALLEPQVVKLDMSLVRDIDQLPVKQKIVKSMIRLARDMGIAVIAEGIETMQERDTVLSLGCDLLQGFYFSRPGPAFPEIRW